MFEDLFHLVGGIVEWTEKKIHHDTPRVLCIKPKPRFIILIRIKIHRIWNGLNGTDQ